ncbi:hypothetical protein QJQ45_015861 [Haematococcus lacustris]|nr:hypothetical protein QJQ45_015861 [Haematococcus lacustris]
MSMALHRASVGARFLRHRCKSVQAVSPVSCTPSQLETVRATLGAKGASVDKVAVSAGLLTGSAILVAAKDIGSGEAVLSISDSAWLGLDAIKRSSIGAAVQGLEPWLQIALLLIQQRFGQPASAEWSWYVSSLPATPNSSPLFWTDEQQAMLQGSQALENMEGYRLFYESRFQQLFGAEGSLSTGPAAAAFPASVFTWPHFLWAAASVRGRSHAPLEGDALALVPLADSVGGSAGVTAAAGSQQQQHQQQHQQARSSSSSSSRVHPPLCAGLICRSACLQVSHRRDGNTRWRVKSTGLFGRGQQLVVEASRPIKKGEELSMDYAPDKLDNSVLLDFGCLDTTSPKAGYQLSLSLSASDPLLDDKLDIVETAGLQASQSFDLQPNQPPPEAMLALLRLMQLQGADAFLLESVFRNDVWGFMSEPVSQPNEAAVCTSMIEGAQAALQGYPASIDADLALLRSGTLARGSVEEMAVQVKGQGQGWMQLMGQVLEDEVRLGEQEALDGLLQWFEERQGSLKRLAYYQERRLRRLGLIDDEGRTTYDSFFEDGIA